MNTSKATELLSAKNILGSHQESEVSMMNRQQRLVIHTVFTIQYQSKVFSRMRPTLKQSSNFVGPGSRTTFTSKKITLLPPQPTPPLLPLSAFLSRLLSAPSAFISACRPNSLAPAAHELDHINLADHTHDLVIINHNRDLIGLKDSVQLFDPGLRINQPADGLGHGLGR